MHLVSTVALERDYMRDCFEVGLIVYLFLCEVGYNFGLRVGERLFMRDCFEVVFIVFVFAVQLVLTLVRKLERDYT